MWTAAECYDVLGVFGMSACFFAQRVSLSVDLCFQVGFSGIFSLRTIQRLLNILAYTGKHLGQKNHKVLSDPFR